MIHIIAVWEAEGIAPVLLDTDQTSNNDQDNQANQHNGSSPDNDAHCRWSLTINYNTVNINADIKYEIRDLLEDQAAILPGQWTQLLLTMENFCMVGTRRQMAVAIIMT